MLGQEPTRTQFSWPGCTLTNFAICRNGATLAARGAPLWSKGALRPMWPRATPVLDSYTRSVISWMNRGSSAGAGGQGCNGLAELARARLESHLCTRREPKVQRGERL